MNFKTIFLTICVLIPPNLINASGSLALTGNYNDPTESIYPSLLLNVRERIQLKTYYFGSIGGAFYKGADYRLDDTDYTFSTFHGVTYQFSEQYSLSLGGGVGYKVSTHKIEKLARVTFRTELW